MAISPVWVSKLPSDAKKTWRLSLSVERAEMTLVDGGDDGHQLDRRDPEARQVRDRRGVRESGERAAKRRRNSGVRSAISFASLNTMRACSRVVAAE